MTIEDDRESWKSSDKLLDLNEASVCSSVGDISCCFEPDLEVRWVILLSFPARYWVTGLLLLERSSGVIGPVPGGL